jgi:C1A family cysteine protease
MAKKTISFDALQQALKQSNADWHAAENTGATDERGLGYEPGPGEASLAEREKLATLNYQQFLKLDRGAFGFPASFDLRNVGGNNYITSIKNQGGCGSCVAFGTVGALEGSVRFQRGNPTLAVDYSEAHLYYCYAKAEGRTCASGWWPDNSFTHLQTGGVVDEACFPYTAGDQNCNLCADYTNRLTKISAWHKITSPADIKTWLTTKGPVAACFTVYEDFYYHYSAGVYRYTNGAVVGGHCVTIVGYNEASQYWICKNQWGAGWGESGYFRIGYGQCGIDSAVWAIDGVIETGWVSNVMVQGLWSNTADSNVWAYLSTLGWRKLAVFNIESTIGMLTQLASAKAAGRSVSVYLNNSLITTIYGN